MKRIFVLAALAILSLGVKAQALQANYLAAKYYAYDTTTFFLGIDEDVALIIVDFTNLNDDDAVLFLGGATEDAERAVNFSWSSNAVDSLIMNPTTYLKTVRNSAGTRYKRSYYGFRNTYSFPADILAVTIVWNSVTAGNVKIFYGHK